MKLQIFLASEGAGGRSNASSSKRQPQLGLHTNAPTYEQTKKNNLKQNRRGEDLKTVTSTSKKQQKANALTCKTSPHQTSRNKKQSDPGKNDEEGKNVM